MANGVASAGTANWDRGGYAPSANAWAPAGQPAVVNGTTDENQWAAGYQPETYDPTFNFNPLQQQQQQQQGGFHPPAPVVDTFTNGGQTNGFRPRPSPQPQQIQIGGFSPHMTSPHPSPGSGQQMNGRCGSVPPHFNGQDGVFMNGSPFTSPSPRPPSSNNPPSGGGDNFRNGGGSNSVESNGQQIHPNGPPGYPSPSPIPHQSSLNSNGGYPGQQQQQQQQQVKSEPWEPDSKQQRSTPHEELNNRLKEKILSKQQMQQQQQQHSFQQQHELQSNGGQGYYMNYPYQQQQQQQQNNEEYSDQHFNPPSASSPSSSTGNNNVRLDVHLEPNSTNSSTAHFLGPAHPQNSGTGGGNHQGEDQQQQQQIPQLLQSPTTTSPSSPAPPQQQQQQQPRNNGCQVNHLTPTSAAPQDLEQDRLNKLKNNVKDEVPPCQCFPSDQCKSPVR
jgi:hypothetical protein